MFRRIFLYPGPLWRLTAINAWILSALGVLVLGSLFLIMILLRFSISAQSVVIRLWFRWACACCFFRFETRHLGDYDPSKPCLIVSNHQSLLDIPAAFFAFSGNVRMVAKKELFMIPLFGQCMRVGGFIPLLRGDRKSSAKVLKLIREAFEKGVQVWVAPEGTRSRDGELSDYKRGSFGLAIGAQVPIQPIVVLDSYSAFSRHDILPRVGAVIHSVTLPQISTLGIRETDKGELAKQVRELSGVMLGDAQQL